MFSFEKKMKKNQTKNIQSKHVFVEIYVLSNGLLIVGPRRFLRKTIKSLEKKRIEKYN